MSQLNKTVYVGGLAPGVVPEKLIAAFAPNRPVHAVCIRSFGFCTFESSEAAAAAAEQNVQIDDRLVHCALSHSRYRSVKDVGPSRASNGRNSSTSSIFIKIPHARKQQPIMAVQQALANACGAMTNGDARHRINIPRKGGSSQHRGYAFVECGSAADAAALLAGLQGSEWIAEMVRKARKAPKRRGRRGGRNRRGKGQFYEDDFHSDDSEDGFTTSTASAMAAATLDEAHIDGGDADGASGGEDNSEEEAGSGGEDACIEAMAAFVSESREWALSVQGFLVDHCRSFDDSEENKLEWTMLHQELVGMMEELLEMELRKLGVGVEEFVQRLQASCSTSRTASDLIDAVLAMDDFHVFKKMMLRLKADLDLANLSEDTLTRFASGSSGTSGSSALSGRVTHSI